MAINAEVETVDEDVTEVAEVEAPAKPKRSRKAKAKAEEPGTEVAVIESSSEVEEFVPLTERQAKALDKKIKAATEQVNVKTNQLIDLLEQAAQGQIHIALGYNSWTAWFSESVQIKASDKVERKALAALMSGRGMSQRAIASTLGVSQKTIDRDLEGEDTGDETLGTDGKVHPKAKARKEVEPEAEVIDAEVVDDEESGEAEPMTAVEILEAFEVETANLFQAQSELTELMKEDKWSNARRRATKAHLNNIQGVIKSLQDIVDDMMAV